MVSEFASALGRAQSMKSAALKRLGLASTDQERKSAMRALRDAEDARRAVADAKRAKGRYVRKSKGPSWADKEAERVGREHEAMREGMRVLSQGIDLAECDGTLEDWIDDARDALEIWRAVNGE